MILLHDAEKLKYTVLLKQTSGLDYCIVLHAGCPAVSLNMLQSILNAAPHTLNRKRNSDHITPVLLNLYCLPITRHVNYKG